MLGPLYLLPGMIIGMIAILDVIRWRYIDVESLAQGHVTITNWRQDSNPLCTALQRPSEVNATDPVQENL